jgi:hypothetical protein
MRTTPCPVLREEAQSWDETGCDGSVDEVAWVDLRTESERSERGGVLRERGLQGHEGSAIEIRPREDRNVMVEPDSTRVTCARCCQCWSLVHELSAKLVCVGRGAGRADLAGRRGDRQSGTNPTGGEGEVSQKQGIKGAIGPVAVDRRPLRTLQVKSFS